MGRVSRNTERGGSSERSERCRRHGNDWKERLESVVTKGTSRPLYVW